MNPKILDKIICPECNSSLSLFNIEEYQIDKEKFIKNGILYCENRHVYPIEDQIPKLLPFSINLIKDDFIKSIQDKSITDVISNRQNKDFPKNFMHIYESFSSEWLEIQDGGFAWGESIEARQKMLQQCFDTDLNEFNGKSFLDAGAGHGEILYSIANENIEIFAIEMSESVQLIKKYLNQNYPVHEIHIHLIQANIHNLPLKNNLFDFINSAGVLHHTPDTYKGFSILTERLKSNGKIYIEVYSTEHKNIIELVQYHIFRFLRFITIHLNHKILHMLCYLISIPAYIYTKLYNKFFNSNHYNNRSFKEMELSIFDALSPKYDYHHTTIEVKEWYSKLGFKNIKKTFMNHNGIGILGEK